MPLLQNHCFKNLHPYLLVGWLTFLCLSVTHGQTTPNRIPTIEAKLNSLLATGAPLDDSITISMNSSIQEFITFLGESTGLNITIEPEKQANITVTFTEAKVKDVILHLCEAYELDVRLTGNIIRLIRFEKLKELYRPKELNIKYAGSSGVSLNLQRDTLDRVIAELSELTGQNIVVEPVIRYTEVSGYVNKVPLEKALEQLALNNDLSYEKKDNFYYLGAYQGDPNSPRNRQKLEPAVQTEGLFVKKINGEKVEIKAIDVPILALIQEVAIELNEDYLLLPEVTLSNYGSTRSNNSRNIGDLSDQNNRSNIGSISRNNQRGNDQQSVSGSSDNKVSMQLKAASFAQVLKEATKNSDYTYDLINGLVTIGLRNAETLRETQLVKLRYRSARDMLGFIPQEMQLGVTVDTLLELNSLILNGSAKNISELLRFINKVDQIVPVITIELMIVDVQTNLMDEFGVEIGSTPGGKAPGGIVVGGEAGREGVDFTPSQGSINKVLKALAGANIINLGLVSADFFLSIKAIEEQGLIEVKSTPKLSTLNSHTARMSVGQTRYYQIEEVNFPGVNNPIPVQSQRFESIDANLAINITPIVSGDEQVTLEIYFEQSEFTAIPDQGPPPTVSRKFDSSIRVRNGEMIVLGGLERDSNSKTTRGVPGISRVPIIGWFFGKKSKTTRKEKLLIFIKPTVTY